MFGRKMGGSFRMLSPYYRAETGCSETPSQLPFHALVNRFRLRPARLQLREILVDCLINPEGWKLVVAYLNT